MDLWLPPAEGLPGRPCPCPRIHLSCGAPWPAPAGWELAHPAPFTTRLLQDTVLSLGHKRHLNQLRPLACMAHNVPPSIGWPDGMPRTQIPQAAGIAWQDRKAAVRACRRWWFFPSSSSTTTNGAGENTN